MSMRELSKEDEKSYYVNVEVAHGGFEVPMRFPYLLGAIFDMVTAHTTKMEASDIE